MRRLIMHHTMPEIDESVFRHAEWTDFCGDVIKEDPPNMPVSLGNAVQMSCFVDADHAGNKVTWGSHTGVFILLNNTPCGRVQQTTKYMWIKHLCFGIGSDAYRERYMVSALRIKLKCFGITLWAKYHRTRGHYPMRRKQYCKKAVHRPRPHSRYYRYSYAQIHLWWDGCLPIYNTIPEIPRCWGR